MTTTQSDAFDYDDLVLRAEADIARREYEQERRELLDAEAEEREVEDELLAAWMDERQRAIDEEDLKANLAVVAQKQRAGQALTAFDRLVLECAEALE